MPETSIWARAVQPENIAFRLVADERSGRAIEVSAEQLANILLKLVPLDVTKLDTSNDVKPEQP